MADPIITDHFRVLAVWQRPSGLPEDQVVNSWVFRNDVALSSPDDMADRCRTVLDDFYNDAAPGFSVKSFMSPELSSLTYRVYDLGQAPPRIPYVRPSLDWTTPGGTPLPSETAVAFSYYATRNLPRRRGRLFIGSLGTTAGTASAGVLRPSSGLRNALANRGRDLINKGGGNVVTWVMLSPTDADVKVITNGWIDDAFDTIRKRGHDATARTLYSATVG